MLMLTCKGLAYRTVHDLWLSHQVQCRFIALSVSPAAEMVHRVLLGTSCWRGWCFFWEQMVVWLCKIDGCLPVPSPRPGFMQLLHHNATWQPNTHAAAERTAPELRKKKKWCEEVQLNYCLANMLWFRQSLLLLHDYFSATVKRRLEIVDGRKISHQLYVTRGWWASRFLHLHIFSCLPQNDREALHFSLYIQYRSTRIASWQMDSLSYGHLKEKGTRMFLTALRFKQLVSQIMKLHIHMQQLVWLKINEQVPADRTAVGV